MKVLHINMTYDYGSTGRFIKYIKEALEQRGDECKVVCCTAKGNKTGIYETQSKLISYAEIVIGRALGNHGLNCKLQTRKAIRFIDEFKPDIIHLHNLHGDYINFELLFDYIKKKNIPVIWKLPDCWAFTGHCVYFDYVKCDKWLNKCGECPQRKQYPKTWFLDRSRMMLQRKKAAFSGVKKMIICPPSDWLNGEAKKSYLSQYRIVTVNNGIDENSFKPMNDDKVKELRKNGHIILVGVVFCFDIRKGLDCFNYLAEKLPDNFDIIIVGFTDDKHYMNSRIKIIPRTESVTELAEYYSAADFFINPTLEENFPSVNIESLACGTPIIAYKTGGAPEAITEKTGVIVERDNQEEMLQTILRLSISKPFKQADCVERSKHFTKQIMIDKYLSLYKEALEKK